MTKPISVRRRCLMLEDDPIWRESVKLALLDTDWRINFAPSASEAENALRGGVSYDLFIVDRKLDDATDGGAAFIRGRRVKGDQTPILVLSLSSSAPQRVAGLAAGADDYLCKPFDPMELVLRLDRLSARNYPPLGLVIDGRTLSVTINGFCYGEIEKRLPPKPRLVLTVLIASGGLPVSKQHLWREVWADYANLPPQDRAIEAVVSRLRRALTDIVGRDVIVAARGQGYRLECNDL